MGVRRMWALITGLPADSATWRGDAPKWTQQDELAASLVEMLDLTGRRLMAWTGVLLVLSQKGGKLPVLPKPVEMDLPNRPTPQRAAEQTPDGAAPMPPLDPAAVKAFFGRRMH